MDRAHRLGQTRTVTVYRLLMRGTLEERIMGLQQFKIDMANAGGWGACWGGCLGGVYGWWVGGVFGWKSKSI